MKILFAVSGIGRGHSTRIDAIIQELKGNPKIIIAGFGESYEHFKDKYKTYKFYGVKAFQDSVKFSVPKTFLKNINILWMMPWNTMNIEKLIDKEKPDIIVSDFEYYAINAANKKHISCISIFDYNPFQNMRLAFWEKIQKIIVEKIYRKNFVCIPSFTAEKSNKNIKFTSLIVRTKPSALPSAEKIRNTLKIQNPVIVYLGNTEYGREIEKVIIKTLPEEELIIFTGRRYENLPKNIRIYSFSENFLEYLKAAKCVMSTAGFGTISESLIYGIPGLFFAIPGVLEHKANAESVDKVQTGKTSSNTKAEDIENDIKTFMKNVEKYRQNLRKIRVKANGAKEIADYIEKLSRAPK